MTTIAQLRELVAAAPDSHDAAARFAEAAADFVRTLLTLDASDLESLEGDIAGWLRDRADVASEAAAHEAVAPLEDDLEVSDDEIERRWQEAYIAAMLERGFDVVREAQLEADARLNDAWDEAIEMDRDFVPTAQRLAAERDAITRSVARSEERAALAIAAGNKALAEGDKEAAERNFTRAREWQDRADRLRAPKVPTEAHAAMMRDAEGGARWTEEGEGIPIGGHPSGKPGDEDA